MTDLDKMALELLAAELERSGAATEAVESLRHADLVSPAIAVSTRAIRTALLTAPPGYVMVPLELAGRLQVSIGAFVSDEGWGAADMGTADDLSALLAAAPEVK